MDSQMNKKEKIEREINKTLEQFEKAERLPANPFFFTRVQQRINERSVKQPAINRFLKPALVTGLLAVNILTFVWYFTVNNVNDTTSSRQELIELLSADFNLDNDQKNIFLP